MLGLLAEVTFNVAYFELYRKQGGSQKMCKLKSSLSKLSYLNNIVARAYGIRNLVSFTLYIPLLYFAKIRFFWDLFDKIVNNFP